MTGGAGINTVSSAQSRWVDTGVEHGVTGLGRGETRDGGGKPMAEGGLEMAAAVKGMEGGGTTCSGSSRGELELVGHVQGVGGGQGV
jgi:hypothetical protein